MTPVAWPCSTCFGGAGTSVLIHINAAERLKSIPWSGAMTFIAFIQENSLGNIDRCALLRLWIRHIPDAWRGNGELYLVRSMAGHLQRLLSYHDRQFQTDAVGL